MESTNFKDNLELVSKLVLKPSQCDHWCFGDTFQFVFTSKLICLFFSHHRSLEFCFEIFWTTWISILKTKESRMRVLLSPEYTETQNNQYWKYAWVEIERKWMMYLQNFSHDSQSPCHISWMGYLTDGFLWLACWIAYLSGK